MNPRLLTIVTFGLAAVFAAAVPASAQLMPGQARMPRPSGGLFGGGFGNTGQGLTLTAAAGAGYDDDLLNKPVASSSRSGVFSNGRANLSYRVSRDSVRANLTVAAAARYYPELANPLVTTYFADGTVSFSMGKRTTASTSYHLGRYLQNLTFFYNYTDPTASGASIAQGGIPDPGTLSDTFLSVRTDAQLDHKLSTRWSIYGRFSYYSDDAGSATGRGRYDSQNAGAGVSFLLAQGLGLRLGYSASTSGSAGGTLAGKTSYDGRTIDIGIDFNKTLSLTRRTKLSFATGAAGINDQTQTTRYYAVGHVNVDHELGRSWTMNGNFRRSVEFDQVFGQPVIADSVTGGVTGMLSQRVETSAYLSAVRGVIGIASGATKYNSANASVGIRYGITRELALGLRYSLYRYDFANGPTPLPGLLSVRERQTVTVTLNTWLPLYTRSRRVNASR